MNMKISECILCGKKYTHSQIGLMNCMVHPLILNRSCGGKNFQIGHYECCGASINNFYCSIHYEASNPKGCHRIDHVSSQEELELILNKPFVCIMDNKQLQLSKIKEVIFISGKNYLKSNNSYKFKMPFDKQYNIDIKKEYDSLLKTENIISLNPIIINHSLSSQQYYTYSEEEQLKYTQEQNSTNFYPFYIIRRMDFKIDDEKKNEIKSYISCL